MEIKIKKTIDSTSNNIQGKIIAFLNDSGYRVVQNSNHYISFDDEIDTQWKLRSNLRYYKITEARFDFITDENNTTVSLIYNLDITFEMLFLIVSIGCAIYMDHIYFFGSVVIILSLLAKFFITRTEAGNMVKNILKTS